LAREKSKERNIGKDVAEKKRAIDSCARTVKREDGLFRLRSQKTISDLQQRFRVQWEQKKQGDHASEEPGGKGLRMSTTDNSTF